MILWQEDEKRFMDAALKQAEQAARANEVPVGAIVVHEGRIIGRGYNKVEAKQDVTQHAEIIAIKQAVKKIGSWRLENCDLYVTLEPCAMCAGAIIWARIRQVIYSADDPKAGACKSVVKVLGNKQLNHRPLVKSGLMAEESSALLKRFFKEIREKKKIDSCK